MRRLIWLALACAALFVFVGCSSESSSDQGGGKNASVKASSDGDYMLLDKHVFKYRKAGPVKFNHDEHFDSYGLDCKECHHKFSNGKNVWTEDDPVQPCEACHDPVKAQGKLYRLQDAFHKNCKGCHLEMNGGDVNGSAPFKCSGCHEPRKG